MKNFYSLEKQKWIYVRIKFTQKDTKMREFFAYGRENNNVVY